MNLRLKAFIFALNLLWIDSFAYLYSYFAKKTVHRSKLVEIRSAVDDQQIKQPSARGRYPAITIYDEYYTKFIQNDANLGSLYDSIADKSCFSEHEKQRMHIIFPALSKLDWHTKCIPKLLFMHLACSFTFLEVKQMFIEQPQLFGLEIVQVYAARHAYYSFISAQYSIAYKLTVSDFVQLLKCRESNVTDFVAILLALPSSTIAPFTEFKARLMRGGLAAVKAGDANMVALFLQYGWHPDSDIDRQQRTVLMWAASNPARINTTQALSIIHNIVDFYKRWGYLELELKKRSNHGDSLLHWAATSNSLPIFHYIHHDLSASLDIVNNDQTHVVHWAAGSGTFDIIQYLIDDLQRTDLLHLQNIFGCTAVHFAVSGGQLEVCKYLFAHNADFLLKNHHGHDPLTKAVAFKQNHVLLWLFTTVPGVIETVHELRPWEKETSRTRSHLVREGCESYLSLLEVAELVGNQEGITILSQFM